MAATHHWRHRRRVRVGLENQTREREGGRESEERERERCSATAAAAAAVAAAVAADAVDAAFHLCVVCVRGSKAECVRRCDERYRARARDSTTLAAAAAVPSATAATPFGRVSALPGGHS